jgi:two-component system cell cycle sensor histidine kinase/response regulator CckA
MEEAKKLHFSNLVHPEDLAMVTENFRKRQAGEEVPRNYEFRVLTRSGETIYVDYNASFIEREGKTVGIQAIVRDVTERKRAEELLRNAEADWRNSFNSLADVMLIIDRDLGSTILYSALRYLMTMEKS